MYFSCDGRNYRTANGGNIYFNVKTDATCNGGSNGTITVTASGGSGAGFTYSKDNGATFQASNIFNALAANTYQIVVKDGVGCISAATGVIIGQPTAVTFTDVKTDVTCNGAADGAITVTAAGGSGAGFTYSNDNGVTFQASNLFNGLAPNTVSDKSAGWRRMYFCGDGSYHHAADSSDLHFCKDG